MSYGEYYHLSGAPFSLTPDSRFFFLSATHRKALAYLGFGLAQGEGFIVITGGMGTGKTMLVDHLVSTANEAETVLASLSTSALDPKDLLKIIAFRFGVPTQGKSKGDLLIEIEHRFKSLRAEGRRPLLIIDEAQTLPISSLEEIRMLSNLHQDGTAFLPVFLLGQPEFREKLVMSEDLEQLRQRVVASHHLEGLQREEVGDYLESRLQCVGWQGNPQFTPFACDVIYDHSHGIPRKINKLAARALLMGAMDELQTIDGPHIEALLDEVDQETLLGMPPDPAPDAEPVPGTASPVNIAERIQKIERKLTRQESAMRSILSLLEEMSSASVPPPDVSPVPGDDA